MMNTPAQGSQIVTSAASSPEDDVQMLYEQPEMAPQAGPAADPREREDHLRAREVAAPSLVPSEPARTPVVQTPSFPEVYQQAGIRAPAHGFTILKIADMVSSNYLRELAREGKRAAILMALEASNVQIQDVIEDGAQRDLALNEYEAHQQKTFQDFKAQKQQQNQEIQAEIERLTQAYRATIQANEKEVAEEKARLDEWRAKKREEERRLRTAASHFVPNSNGNGNAEAANAEPDPGAPSAQRQPSEMLPLPAPASAKASEVRPPAAKGAEKRISLWKR
jgi:hypothetical protein